MLENDEQWLEPPSFFSSNFLHIKNRTRLGKLIPPSSRKHIYGPPHIFHFRNFKIFGETPGLCRLFTILYNFLIFRFVIFRSFVFENRRFVVMNTRFWTVFFSLSRFLGRKWRPMIEIYYFFWKSIGHCENSDAKRPICSSMYIYIYIYIYSPLIS